MSYNDEDEIKMAYLTQVLLIDDEVAERNVDSVILFEGNAVDYAQELIDDIGFESLRNPDYYFDYSKYGRDIRLSGIIDGDPNFEDLSDYNIGEIVGGMTGFENMTKNELDFYIDYDALARDLVMGGDVDEFDYDGSTYVIANAMEDFEYYNNPRSNPTKCQSGIWSWSTAKKSKLDQGGICARHDGVLINSEGNPVTMNKDEFLKKIRTGGLDDVMAYVTPDFASSPSTMKKLRRALASLDMGLYDLEMAEKDESKAQQHAGGYQIKDLGMVQRRKLLGQRKRPRKR